jgi:hypothetical protein
VVSGGVDSGSALRLAIGIFAYALIRGTVLDYWGWRSRRRALPHGLRNSGFITDGKVRVFEWTALSMFVLNAAFILAFVVWFVGAANEWWEPYWPL